MIEFGNIHNERSCSHSIPDQEAQMAKKKGKKKGKKGKKGKKKE